MAKSKHAKTTSNMSVKGGGGGGDSRVLTTGGRPSAKAEFSKDANSGTRKMVTDRVKNARRR